MVLVVFFALVVVVVIVGSAVGCWLLVDRGYGLGCLCLGYTYLWQFNFLWAYWKLAVHIPINTKVAINVINPALAFPNSFSKNFSITYYNYIVGFCAITDPGIFEILIVVRVCEKSCCFWCWNGTHKTRACVRTRKGAMKGIFNIFDRCDRNDKTINYNNCYKFIYVNRCKSNISVWVILLPEPESIKGGMIPLESYVK